MTTQRESPAGGNRRGSEASGSGGPGFEGEDTTDDQPDLFTALEEARRARDAGAEDALNAAHGWVRVHLQEHLDALIRSGQEFTAETVRERAGTPLASSPNVLGSVILAASKAGRIEHVGYTEATRREAHRRVLRVWRGVGGGGG